MELSSPDARNDTLHSSSSLATRYQQSEANDRDSHSDIGLQSLATIEAMSSSQQDRLSTVEELGQEPGPDSVQEHRGVTAPAAVVSSEELFLDRIMKTRKKGDFEVFFTTSLIIDNMVTEARDLLAAERNFMSLQRWALYLGLAGGVLLLNVRLPVLEETPDSENEASDVFLTISDSGLSRSISLPLACIFFIMSLIGQTMAIINYAVIIARYAKRDSIVSNSRLTYGMVVVAGLAILATNIIYLIYPNAGEDD